MDKRYLIIFIIIILCCVNLYVISDYSDVIGTASLNIDNYTCSLPQGFSFYKSGNNEFTIYNSESGMYVNIYSNPNDNYTSMLANINGSKDRTLLSEGTININNVDIQSIYYNYTDSNTNVVSTRAAFYFTFDETDFKILISNFDYNNEREDTIRILGEIVNSFRVNHKL